MSIKYPDTLSGAELFARDPAYDAEAAGFSYYNDLVGLDSRYSAVVGKRGLHALTGFSLSRVARIALESGVIQAERPADEAPDISVLQQVRDGLQTMEAPFSDRGPILFVDGTPAETGPARDRMHVPDLEPVTLDQLPPPPQSPGTQT